MLNTSAVSVFKTFSKEEIKKFEDFLLSPYFNKKSVLVNLFKIIKRHEPEYISELLDRKKIWSKLYKNKEFNYGVMKNLIYDLGKAADKFIELQNFERDKKLSAITLMQEQKIRNLNNAFEKSLKTFKNDLSEKKQDFEFFYYNYRALKLEREFTSNLGLAKAESRINEENEIEFLSLFYLLECADLYNCFFINGAYVKKDLKNNNLDLFINFVEKFQHNYKEISDCSLLNLKIMLNKNDKDLFLELKKIFTDNSYKFSSSFSGDLGLSLSEYCSRYIMNGKTEFINEQFDICLFIFENGLLMDDKKEFMSPHIFTSLVSTACSLKKFDWVKLFIENNIGKIHPEFRDKYYNFANLTLNFKMNNFSEAHFYVSKMDINSPMDYVSVKRFQLMIYYESGYTDELYSLIEAVRNFISKNKKITKSLRLQAGNFINYTKRLSNMKFSNSFKKIDLLKLKDEILELEVINKNWLIEKAEELK